MSAAPDAFAKALRDALQALGSGESWLVEYRDLVDSTMSEARRLVFEGAGERSAVVAGEQSAGRGRRERVFVSPAGGLYVTALVAAPPRLEDAWRLSFVGALAAARALEAAGLRGLRFEWPNDLLVGARKVGGVLSELLAGAALPDSGRAPLVLVGVGLNTGPDPRGIDPERSGAAGALELGPGDPRPALCARLLHELGALAARARDPLGWRDVLQSVRGLSALRGSSTLRVRRHDGSELSGVPWDLHEDGSLELRSDAGEMRIVRYGEVVRD